MSDPLLVSQLWDALSSEKRKDTEAEALQFLRDQIHKTSVLWRVLPPESVTSDKVECNGYDCYPRVSVPDAFGGHAFSIGYKRWGEAKYFKGPSLECYLNRYESQHYIKCQINMATVRSPVACQIIEPYFVTSIRNALDWDFRHSLDAAAALSGQIIKSEPGCNPSHLVPLVRAAKKLMADGTGDPNLGGGASHDATRVIMPECRWVDVETLDGFGQGNAGLITTGASNQDGKAFLGLDVVLPINSRCVTDGTTNEGEDIAQQTNGINTPFRTGPANDPEDTDRFIWPVNSIYLVTDPEFLGVNYKFGDIDQWYERVGDLIDWWSYCAIGHAINNVKSIVRIDLIP